MDLASQIAAIMDREPVNKSELSRRSGYDRSALTNLLNGVKDDINVGTLQKIADALDCDLRLVPRTKSTK